MRSSVCLHAGSETGLSQLLRWLNFLYHMLGISEVAWIICALLCLTGSMTRCLSVLLFAVFACALFFWSLELQGQFRRFEDPLLKPIFTSFFSDFDPGDPINSRFKTII